MWYLIKDIILYCGRYEMTKRLVFVAAALFCLFGSDVADAKVCRTGDPDCATSELLSGGSGGCDLTVYKRCDTPRVGAPFCLVGGEDTSEAYYKEEDCCSSGNYEECDAAQNAVGQGKSCQGTDGKIRYSSCACATGFGKADDPEGEDGLKIEVIDNPLGWKFTF